MSKRPISDHFKRCQPDDTIILFSRSIHHWLTGRHPFRPKEIILFKPEKCSWTFTSNFFLILTVSINIALLVFHKKKIDCTFLLNRTIKKVKYKKVPITVYYIIKDLKKYEYN